MIAPPPCLNVRRARKSSVRAEPLAGASRRFSVSRLPSPETRTRHDERDRRSMRRCGVSSGRCGGRAFRRSRTCDATAVEPPGTTAAVSATADRSFRSRSRYCRCRVGGARSYARLAISSRQGVSCCVARGSRGLGEASRKGRGTDPPIRAAQGTSCLGNTHESGCAAISLSSCAGRR